MAGPRTAGIQGVSIATGQVLNSSAPLSRDPSAAPACIRGGGRRSLSTRTKRDGNFDKVSIQLAICAHPPYSPAHCRPPIQKVVIHSVSSRAASHNPAAFALVPLFALILVIGMPAVLPSLASAQAPGYASPTSMRRGFRSCHYHKPGRGCPEPDRVVAAERSDGNGDI